MKNSSKSRYEHPLSGIHAEFTWCLHCERVHKTREWVERGWECPEEGCDGGILDASSWGPDDWPKSVNPDYPDVPVEGERYPLYGVNCID